MKEQNDIKILAIIPARGGSKGIPRKNIADLGGKPLIYYTIREAKRSQLIDASIVSTDDEEIAEVARKCGADVPFLRPKELAGDLSRDIDFLKHAVLWLEENRGWRPEIIVLLQPTSPSRTGRDIDRVLKFMIETGCDSVRTVVNPSPYNPFKMWQVVDSQQKIIKPLIAKTNCGSLGSDVPRQLLPQFCQPVGLVYTTKTKFIKQGQVWGDDVRAFYVSTDKYVDIDNIGDLLHAEEVLKRLQLL